MGLRIHSIDVLPKKLRSEYFVYLLDYGWDEPVVNILHRNSEKLVEYASKYNTTIISGTSDMGHFSNEVLSFHSIGGKDARNILPALLITKTNPHKFKSYSDVVRRGFDKDFRCLVVPLRKIGANENEGNVLGIIESIMIDIQYKKDLEDFAINKSLRPDLLNAFINGFMFEPNVAGIGFSFNNFISRLKGKD